MRGNVIYIDRFGNGVTNLPNKLVGGDCRTRQVACRNRRIPVEKFYQAVPKGRTVAVPGSSGFLEIAINGGHAERELNLRVGSVALLSESFLTPADGNTTQRPIAPKASVPAR